MARHAAVIAYDIASDKRRRQVARCLRAWRLDGQYSLIETRLTETEAHELFLQLTDLLDPAADALLLAWLDNTRPAAPITRAGRIGFRAPALYID